MINKKNLKRKVSILLAASMVLGSATVCSAEAVNNEKGEIKVLENQQQEINDVLAIKEIDELQYFYTESWLNNDEIIGISNDKQVDNVCIFNSNTDEMITVTDNTDKDVVFEILGLSPIEKQLNNDYCIIEEYKESKRSTSLTVHAFNLKDHTVKKIEEKISSHGKVNNNKLIITKMYDVYEYNLATGEKEQIVIPDEIKNIREEVPSSFEEYIAQWDLDDDLLNNENYMNFLKEMYQDKKESPGRGIYAEKNQNKLMLRAENGQEYVYDLDTKTYEECDNSYKTYGFKLNPTSSMIEIEEIGDNNKKIWKLDENGERCKLIDEGVVDEYSESLDHSKLAYSMIEDCAGCQFANEVKTYICDLNSGKKISVYVTDNIDPGLYWNDASDKLYYKESDLDRETDENKYVTNVVTLN